MQKDLENLAKEMQALSDIRGEFSSDKEFFLHQLNCWKPCWHHLESKEKLIFALTKKLTEKSTSISDFNSKKELVEKGFLAYFEAPERKCAQFRKIVRQKPEIIVKSSSKASQKRRKSQRVYE